MQAFIKDNWVKIAIGSPVIVGLFGLLINNNYLLSYGIINYSAFQIRALYSGAIFFALIIFIIIIFLIDSNIIDLDQMNPLRLLYVTFYKTIFVADLACIMLINDYAKISIFGIQIPESISYLYYGLLIFYIWILVLYIDEFRGEIKYKNVKLLKIFSVFIFFLVLFHFIILHYNYHKQVADISSFFISMFFAFVLGNLGRKQVRIYKKTDKEYRPFSLIDRNRGPSTIDMTIVLLLFIAFFILSVVSYRGLYKYIPYAFGGGKLSGISIKLNDNTVINGKLIISNDQYVYVEDNDKIIQVKKEQILNYTIDR
jgi:hypothetical protein